MKQKTCIHIGRHIKSKKVPCFLKKNKNLFYELKILCITVLFEHKKGTQCVPFQMS